MRIRRRWWPWWAAFGLVLAFAAASSSVADDNPRGWHVEKSLTPAERSATLKTLGIMEKECPPLAETNELAHRSPHDKDPKRRVVPAGPTYPKAGAVWGGPAVAGWTVEFHLFVHGAALQTINIIAGGPSNPGLAGRVGGEVLGGGDLPAH